MKLNNNFETLLEMTLARFQQGGFLIGDLVKIKPDALSNEFIKDKGNNYKAVIKDMINGNFNIRICAIKSDRATNSTTLGGADAPNKLWADIVWEIAPGRWVNPITVPIEVIEAINPEEIGTLKLPDIPNNLRRKNPEKNIEEVDAPKNMVEPQKMTTINTKLPNSQKWDDSAPGGGNAPKNKPKEFKKEEVEITNDKKALELIYEKIL